jgi:hypothetical protein
VTENRVHFEVNRTVVIAPLGSKAYHFKEHRYATVLRVGRRWVLLKETGMSRYRIDKDTCFVYTKQSSEVVGRAYDSMEEYQRVSESDHCRRRFRENMLEKDIPRDVTRLRAAALILWVKNYDNSR